MLPSHSCLSAFSLTGVKKVVIVCLVDLIGLSAFNDVQRMLFDDVSFGVNDAQVKQMAFTAVQANEMHIRIFSKELIDLLIQIWLVQHTKVQGDGHMELKMVHRVTTVFDEVISEDTVWGTKRRGWEGDGGEVVEETGVQ